MGTIMRLISAILGMVSLILMLVAFTPLLGWLNWVVIPFAVISLIISSISNSSAGKTMCTVAIICGVLRLFFGGGIF
jgi:hypothetical protein